METQKKTKKPIDYSKGKIYKIVCDTTGLIYIGSTVQKLCERLRGHRSKYKIYLKGEHNFNTSFDIIKNNNYKIILINNYPCNSREELEKEERKYIESVKCINKNIPTRTDKEYYQDNIYIKKKQQKEYYQNNKDKLKKQQKEYYENNRNEILEKNKNNKTKIVEQHKEYYEKKKDTIKEYSKEYHKNNRDKILEKNKIKIECEYCKLLIIKRQLNRHQKSLKCIEFQKNLT